MALETPNAKKQRAIGKAIGGKVLNCKKSFLTLIYVLSFLMCYNSKRHCLSLTLNSYAHAGMAEPMKKWYGNRGHIPVDGGWRGVTCILLFAYIYIYIYIYICASMHELCDGANERTLRSVRRRRSDSESGMAFAGPAIPPTLPLT